MSATTNFMELWRENQVARYEAGEDIVHIYIRGIGDVREVETEETENHIRLRCDADTGELVGFSVPLFSAVSGLARGRNDGPDGI